MEAFADSLAASVRIASVLPAALWNYYMAFLEYVGPSQPEPEPPLPFVLDTAALWCAAVPVLLGLLFAGQARELIAEDANSWVAMKGHALTPEAGGFACHFLFQLGVFTLCYGFTNLGLALGFSPALAAAVGMTALFGNFLYMAIADQGMTGVPGFKVPPPVLVLTGVPAVVLNANVCLTAEVVPTSYWVVYLIATLMPHVLAIKARSSGWKVSSSAAPPAKKPPAAPAPAKPPAAPTPAKPRAATPKSRAARSPAPRRMREE